MNLDTSLEFETHKNIVKDYNFVKLQKYWIFISIFLEIPCEVWIRGMHHW